jgi:hypothetical protein
LVGSGMMPPRHVGGITHGKALGGAAAP